MSDNTAGVMPITGLPGMPFDPTGVLCQPTTGTVRAAVKAPAPPAPPEPHEIAGPLAQAFSQPFSRLVAALALAKLEIAMPAKNRTATVTTKGGQTYKFSYADLPAVLQAVDGPLARHGIVQTSILAGRALSVMLLHVSGEWMRSSVDLKPEDERANSLSSACTFMRRTLLQAMLGVAADDDDDGAAGSGDTISAPPPDLAAEMRKWNARRSEWEIMRREDPEEWRRVVDAAASRLERTLGRTVAACWKAVELAGTAAERQAVRDAMDGQWADTLALFRAAEPRAHGELMRHYNDRGTIVDAANASRVPRAAPMERAATGFRQPLISASGDAVWRDGDEEPLFFLAAAPWARAFEEMWRDTPPGDRLALREHNEDAIQEASKSQPAKAVLDGIPGPGVPEEPRPPMAVLPPLRRGGGLDRAAYAAQVKASIEAWVGSAEDAAAWDAANEAYLAEMGGPVRIEVLKAMAARKRDLGIPPPKDA